MEKRWRIEIARQRENKMKNKRKAGIKESKVRKRSGRMEQE